MRYPRLFLLLLLLGCLASPLLAQSSLEWVEKAQQAEDAGNFTEAGKDWEKAAAAFSQESNAPYRAKSLFYAGLAHYKAGAREAAAAQLTLAVEAYLALGDGQGQSLCLVQRGVVEIALGQWTEAERSFRNALEVARRIGNEERALEATEFLGKTLEAGRRWAEATEVTESLVAAYRDRDAKKVADFLSTLGALYQLQGQLEKAEKAYDESIALFEQQGEAEEALSVRRDKARFLLKTHQLEKAESLLAELEKEKPQDAGFALDHASALSQLGRHAEALAKLEKMLPWVHDRNVLLLVQTRRIAELVELGREKEALAQLGKPDFGTDLVRAQVAESIGRRDLAEQYLRKALSAASDADRPGVANELAVKLIGWDKVGEASTLLEATLATLPRGDKRRAVLTSNLAETYLSGGEPAKALPLYLEVVEMARRGEGEVDLTIVLTNIGATYEYLGDYSQALRYLEQAIELGERYQVGSDSQGTIYNSLGLVYVKMGRLSEGITFYQRALAYHRTHGNGRGETASLINLGAAYELMGERGKAADYYEQALTITERDGQVSQQITLLNNLSHLSSSNDRAEKLLEAALKLEKGAPQTLTHNILLSNLADLYYRTGRQEQAVTMARDAAARLQELGAKESELVTRQILLQDSLDGEDSDATDQQLDRCLHLAQDIVTGLSAASARSFLKEHEATLREGLERVLEEDHGGRAFSIDEQLRSLGLASLTNGLPLQSAHVPVELAEREKTLLARMREAASRSADLSGLRAEHKILREQIERHHLAAGALHSLEAATVSAVQQRLRPDEIMLSYVLAGPDVWLLAITQQTVQARRVAALNELQPLISGAYRKVCSAGRLNDVDSALQALSTALWQPAQDLIGGKTRLILIPAGPLFSVPFAALTQDGVPLGERYLLTQASSGTAWVLSRSAQTTGKGALVAALGNFAPGWSEGGFGKAGVRSSSLVPLPGSLQEVTRIAAAMVNPVTLKEQAMTGDALREGSTGRRQLHYATHGLLNNDEPMLSGLVASDRLVTALEIFGWDLDADLAVLSACHSGQISQGLEYVSLTRAFQFAGARTLLATNWAVSDEATAQWMEAFYANLQRGRPADEAAREACIALRKQYPHPYFWAPFALWGDGTVVPEKNPQLR